MYDVASMIKGVDGIVIPQTGKDANGEDMLAV
jgi:hypothetical protein